MHIKDFRKFVEYIENNTVIDTQPSKLVFCEYIATGWGDDINDVNSIKWEFYR